MNIFTSFESEADLDAVAADKKPACLIDFDFQVMRTGLDSQAELLQTRLAVQSTGLLPPLTLVTRSALIHDSANGWPSVRIDFDKVEAQILSHLAGLAGVHFTQHVAVHIDDLNGRDPDLMVDTGLFITAMRVCLGLLDALPRFAERM